MSNTIELRKKITKYQGTPGSEPTIEETWQYRTKDIIIGVLGISLGVWTDWTDIEEVTVVVNINTNI